MCRPPTTTAAPCWSRRACSPTRRARAAARGDAIGHRRRRPHRSGRRASRRTPRRRSIPSRARDRTDARRGCGASKPTCAFLAPTASRATFTLATLRLGRAGMSPTDAARTPATRGFTLLELTVALVLLALMAAMMFGSLSSPGRSWDGGEAKAVQVSEMRPDRGVPARAARGRSFRCARARSPSSRCVRRRTQRDPLRRRAARARRRGGIYFFRLAVVRDGDKSRLVQERVIPDLDAPTSRTSATPTARCWPRASPSCKLAYFGRDQGAADARCPDVARPLGRQAAAAAARAHRRRAAERARVAHARRRAAAGAGGRAAARGTARGALRRRYDARPRTSRALPARSGGRRREARHRARSRCCGSPCC